LFVRENQERSKSEDNSLLEKREVEKLLAALVPREYVSSGKIPIQESFDK